MSKRPPPPKRRPTVGQSQAPSHLQNQGPPQGQPPQGQPHQGQPPQGQPHQGQPPQGQPHQGQPHEGHQGAYPGSSPQGQAPPPQAHGPPQGVPPPRTPPIAMPPNRDTSPSRMGSRQLPPPPTSTPRRNASPLGQGRRPQVPNSRADGSTSPTRRHPDQQQAAPMEHATPDRGGSRPPPPKRRPSMVGAAPEATSPQRARSGSLLPDSRPPGTGEGERPRSASRPPPPKRRPSMTGTAPVVSGSAPSVVDDKAKEEKPKTVRAISEATGVSIADLREANPDLNGVGDDEMIPKGTKLRIPTTPRSLPARRDVPQSPPPQGVSGGGETLAIVAQRAGVPLTAVQSLNPHLAHVDPYMDVLPVGTTLHVPATDAVLESTPAVEDVVVGTPRSEMSQTTPANESILDVARSTNTPVQDILLLNPFLQDYPLDKPLPPKTRIQLPEAEDESSPPSQATSPSTSPAPTLSAVSVLNLRDIAMFYGVPLHDVSGLNIQAAAVFGVDRDIPIGTKINVPATSGYPGGVVHVVGEGPIEMSRQVVSPPAPTAPKTLNDLANIVGHPVEAIRGLGDLDDHVEVGVSCPPRCNDQGMGEPENLWTVSPNNELPSVVIDKLLDAAKTDIGKHRESLDSLSSTTKVDVDHIRRANDELPDGYPSSKPVPRGMRIFIPKPPVATPPVEPIVTERAQPAVSQPVAKPAPVVVPEAATRSITTPPPQTSAGGAFDRYVATGDETLADIASRHGVDLDLLIRMNGALVDDPDEAYTDPLPQGVTVRVPRGSQQAPAPEVVSPLIPARSLSEPTADPDPVPERSVPVVASPFLRRKQLQSQSVVKVDESIEEPRTPPVQATRPISPPTSEPTNSPPRHSISPNRGRHLESDPTPAKFIPEPTSMDANDDDSRRSIPTKTMLASGNESLRNVCDTHFLTEPQLRSMNPFLERYHSGTLIPKNTLIVLETAGFAEDKVAAAHGMSAAKPQVEEVEGRHVFVVKSPTRDRPRAISPHRAMSSPEEPSASGTIPTNTLRAISEAVGIPEQILRRRNPHLGLIGSDDELPKGTIVELDGSAMGPVGGMAASPRAAPSNNTTISLTKRNLNRRQVVRVMGHKTAVQVGQRYFSKWRLFVSLFNSKKMNREITIENEMEKLRVQVQAGKITESDLRRRVTELRMALDSSRPYSDELRGGTVQSPVRRVSPMRAVRNESIAAVAAHNVDDNYYRHAAAGLNTTESPSRLASTPRRLQPVMMAGTPAVTENRVPFDRSREVGGVGASVRVSSPLRDQPTLHDPSTPRRNPSPYRQLMEATAQSVTSPASASKSVDRRNQRRSLGMLLNGLRVVRVSGAASAAGIQSNDLVLRVDGSLVSSGTTFKSLVDRAKGPKVSVTLQTPTGHIFTVMLPLFSDDGRSSPSRGPELSRLADPPSMRQSSPRSTLLSSPYRRPISASRR